jgi:hypothetical protein
MTLSFTTLCRFDRRTEIAMPTKPSGIKPTGRTKSTAVAPQQTGRKRRSVRKNPGPQRPTPDTRPAHRTAPTADRSKQARLIAMLTSPAGGTLKQMMTLTGWQAHSVRGVISGVLRKKLCLDVQCSQVGDVRVYRIARAETTA